MLEVIKLILSFVKLEQKICRNIESTCGERLVFCNVQNPDPKLLSDAEIIFSMGDFDKETLNLCNKLKWLFIMSAGVDSLPFDELLKLGVIVSNVSGIHAIPMAEQAIGDMLLFSRGLLQCLNNQRLKKWERHINDELYGKNLLIIGAGRIGKEIARKARSFDMKITGLKKCKEPLPAFDYVFDMGSFHDVLPDADYTMLVTPLTRETYHLMGAAEFSLMKRGSIFINISRGDTVDEQALIKALQNNILGGAALDVFHNEPLDAASPLWNMPNVLITPHTAGLTPYYFERSASIFLDSYPLYRKGQTLPNLVDLVRQY
jgi:phosphoglycerate dehydrogenase-like enzyme